MRGDKRDTGDTPKPNYFKILKNRIYREKLGFGVSPVSLFVSSQNPLENVNFMYFPPIPPHANLGFSSKLNFI